MSSLTKHLATPGPHAHLPFDPRCPLCCDERLHGTIPQGPIVPARVKASLATALVTVSAATPAASMAQETDHEVEGTELPEPGRGGDPDPGSEAQVPEGESVPAPASPGGDENDEGDGPALQSEPEVDTRSPEELQESGPGAEISPDSLATEEPAAAPKPSPEKGEALDRRADPGVQDRKAEEKSRHARPEARPQRPPDQAAPAVPAQAQPAPSLDSPESLGASAAPDSPKPGARGKSHVVQPGESLWSIAADLAGRDATPAKIARIVNRLWDLNADRIGTGDPDLVMAGTTLRLP